MARARLATLDLLLRALRLRQHHGTRDRDVYAFSHCDTRRGSTALFSCAFSRVLLQPRRITDSLWHDAGADILRRGLHITTHLVDPGTDCVIDNNQCLEFSGIYLLESSQTLVTNMAGYSGTPLAKKLGIKEGSRVALVNAPKDFQSELGELPDNVQFIKRPTKSLDIILLFVLSERALARDFARFAARLTANGMLWIAWPKKSSGVTTDLSEQRVRQIGLDARLVDVKICAIDDVWSGLKFVYRLKDRSALK